jgi:hypothetical protein
MKPSLAAVVSEDSQLEGSSLLPCYSLSYYAVYDASATELEVGARSVL